ncbi:hypothetical protein JCM30760_12330 [Thiomicrorhabdus hydrogeniphila]
MISSVSNTSMMVSSISQNQNQNSQQISLNDEQKQLISDTLAEYDTENLSETDAQSIIAVFQDAGIEPGTALEDEMSIAGFDAQSIGEMGGQRPPPPPGGGPQSQEDGYNVSEDSLEELYSLLDSYYSDTATDADRNSYMSSIEELLGTQSSIFSAKA